MRVLMTERSEGKPNHVSAGRANARAARPDTTISLSLREVRRRFQNGEPVPEAAQKEIIELERALAHIALEVQRLIRSHPDRLIRNMLRATDQDVPDAARLRAARKIKKIVGAGIAKQRRHLVERKLGDLARKHHRTAKKELEMLIISGIYAALEAVDEFTVTDIAGIESTIRKSVNKLATEGVLGPGWREYKNHISFDEESEDKGHAAAVNSEIQREIRKNVFTKIYRR